LYSSQKAADEYKEAEQLGIETVLVLVGPVTYLQLSQAEKSAPQDFDLLSLLDSILPVYKEVIRELKEARPKWV
jgi:5-methyltetrahydropteroyltriglutamate--homocysteine methyltransferase